MGRRIMVVFDGSPAGYEDLDEALVSEAAREAAAAFGGDLWPYGIEANRKTIETFARYAHEQGLTPRALTPEELFPAAPLPVFV